MSETLEYWISNQKKFKNTSDILRQITKRLKFIHNRPSDYVHGELTPDHIYLDEVGEKVIDIKSKNPKTDNEDVSLKNKEWRPAEEHNLPPSKEGDVFSLGCLFYYVISFGQHPFGYYSKHRELFITYHLYYLGRCCPDDMQIRKLIARMIHYDPKQRPTCSEVLKHPFLSGNKDFSGFENTSDDEHDPEMVQNDPGFIIANKTFGFVEAVNNIPRRHGRWGMYHVHVINVEPESLPKLDKLLYKHHQHVLRCVCLSEDDSVLAVEPFEETLETWKKKNLEKLDFEMVESIFYQICNGVRHYDSNQLVHGNLTQQTIVIYSKDSVGPQPEPWEGPNLLYLDQHKILPKIAPFFRHETTESPATMENDIRQLGHIMSDLWKPSPTDNFQYFHLVEWMKNEEDERVPSVFDVLCHPFFWSLDQTFDFIIKAKGLFEVYLTPTWRKKKETLKEIWPKTEEFCSYKEDAVKLLLRNWIRKYPDLIMFTWLELLRLKTQRQFNDEDDDDHWLNMWNELDFEELCYLGCNFATNGPTPADWPYPAIIDALKEISEMSKSLKGFP